MNALTSPFFRLALLLLAFMTPQAWAQMNVSIAIERSNYISYEPFYVTVTVTNTSGNDVVLGGPANSSWLNFLVSSDNGRPVTAISSPDAEAFVCRNGQSIQRRFNLPRYFHLIESGGYVVKASVYFPDLQRWINSRPARFTINQAARPRWEKSVAIPAGHRMAGKYRRYQLFYFHDTARSYLYVRIIDEATGMFLQTCPLSSIVADREMQPAIDSRQNLHVLYLGSPMVWIHHVIDIDGKIVAQKYYRQGKGTPQMITQPTREVVVLGGTSYDPTEKPVTPGPNFRRLSDRPPGLPLQ